VNQCVGSQEEEEEKKKEEEEEKGLVAVTKNDMVSN